MDKAAWDAVLPLQGYVAHCQTTVLECFKQVAGQGGSETFQGGSGSSQGDSSSFHGGYGSSQDGPSSLCQWIKNMGREIL